MPITATFVNWICSSPPPMLGERFCRCGLDKFVWERRYKSVFHFRYRDPDAHDISCAPQIREHQGERNDFIQANNEFLAFAARCTSSFPFAFEPIKVDTEEVAGIHRHSERGALGRMDSSVFRSSKKPNPVLHSGSNLRNVFTSMAAASTTSRLAMSPGRCRNGRATLPSNAS